MLRILFSNRLFIGVFVFFVLTVVGSFLYMQHVERQTTRDLTHTEEHTKQQNEKQKQQAIPLLVEQGTPTPNTIAKKQFGEVERIARYQQRVEQYRKDLELWRQKHSQAYLEWMQASEIDRKSPEEWEMERAYVQSLSDVEKQEYVAKMQAKFERSIDAWERLRTLMKEEPVFPNASQAK